MRKVIYTCIVGAYDALLQPAVLDPEFDFVCFVGPGEKRGGSDGVWNIRELAVPEELTRSAAKDLDPRRLARYAKTHPHEILPEYDSCLWVDANIAILDDCLYRAYEEKIEEGIKFSGVPHPTRDCVYSEARKCRDMRYVPNLGLLRIWAFYALHGIRRHSGLIESNILFRRQHEPEILALDRLWWKMTCRFYLRDQLSLMWCLRKCRIPVDYLLGEGMNSRNHPGLKYLRHK